MFFFTFINRLSDFITAPFSGLSPVAGLCLTSFISAVVLMFIFKWTSNQEKIKFHKDKIFAHFLEIALFRDQFNRTMSCQLNILKHNLIYLRYFLFPLLIIMPPVLLVCMQLDFRLGIEPLKQESSFIVQAKLDNNQSSETSLDNIVINVSDNIRLETPALQSAAEDSLFWRAKIIDPAGPHWIKIGTADLSNFVEKELAVSGKKGRFSKEKIKITSFSENLFSGETAIAPTSNLKSIRVNYLSAEYPFLAWELSPIIYYFVVTLLFGFMLKPFIKVNI